ncbi:MAG: hypothetical protein Q4E47_00390 [Candidatus Saccharibacteria bacterium]|nr:hypothetical protein [Candidatus Saccharibacteria bacterium]
MGILFVFLIFAALINFGLPILIIVLIIRAVNNSKVKKLKEENAALRLAATQAAAKNGKIMSASLGEDIDPKSEPSSDDPTPDEVLGPITTVPETPTTVSEPKRDDTPLNILLLVGAILILASISAFLSSSAPGSIKTIFVIAITLMIYALGLFLYKRVERLKPAAVTLLFIGLAAIPFWTGALNGWLKIDFNYCALITSAVACIVYGYTAYAINNPLLSYLSIFAFMCIDTSVMAVWEVGTFATCFSLLVISGLICIASAVLDHTKKLSSTTKTLIAEPLHNLAVITPLTFIVFSSFFPDNYEPYSRYLTILTGMVAVEYAILFITGKDIISRFLFRVGVHAFIVVLTADLIGETTIASVLIWIGVALAQCLVSLFIKTKNELESGLEAGFGFVSNLVLLIALPLSLMLKDQTTTGVLQLVAVLCSIGFELAYWFKSKSEFWPVFASMGVVTLPIIVISSILKVEDPATVYLFTYLGLAAITIALAFFRRDSKNFKFYDAALTLTVIVCAFASIFTQGQHSYWSGFLLAALEIGTYGALIKNAIWMEVSIYTLCCAFSHLASELIKDGNTTVLVVSHIFAVALLGVSLVKEFGIFNGNDKQSYPRAWFAYAIIFITVGSLALANEGYQIFYLLEQIGVLGIGAATKRKPFAIAGAIGVFLAILKYLSAYSYILLAFLGISIIGVVVAVLLTRGKK